MVVMPQRRGRAGVWDVGCRVRRMREEGKMEFSRLVHSQSQKSQKWQDKATKSNWVFRRLLFPPFLVLRMCLPWPCVWEEDDAEKWLPSFADGGPSSSSDVHDMGSSASLPGAATSSLHVSLLTMAVFVFEL